MIKLIIGLILSILILMFIFFNTQVIDLQLLFWKITISKSLIIIIVLVIGITLGYILSSLSRINEKKEDKEKIKKERKASKEEKTEKKP